MDVNPCDTDSPAIAGRDDPAELTVSAFKLASLSFNLNSPVSRLLLVFGFAFLLAAMSFGSSDPCI